MWARRKQTSPGKNMFPFLFENSSTTSPAQEKKSPTNIRVCKRFLPGFRLTKKKITSMGIISAFEIKPGKKSG
jgi:hypothetical protein